MKCHRKVVEVRLGETDLTTTYDCLDPSAEPSCVCDAGCAFSSWSACVAAKQCAERHVVRGVARQIVHPWYNLNTWVSCKHF